MYVKLLLLLIWATSEIFAHGTLEDSRVIINGTVSPNKIIRQPEYFSYFPSHNNFNLSDWYDYTEFVLNFDHSSTFFYDQTDTSETAHFTIEWGILADGNFYSVKKFIDETLDSSSFPLSLNSQTFGTFDFGTYQFVLRLSKIDQINQITMDGYIIYDGWIFTSGWESQATIDIKDIFDSNGALKEDEVTLVNIDTSYLKTNELWSNWVIHDYSGDYWEEYVTHNHITEELRVNLINSSIVKLYEGLLLEQDQEFTRTENMAIGSTSMHPAFPLPGEVVTFFAEPEDGFVFDKWESSLIYAKEDLDGDGKLDSGNEDLDGDGNFDIGEVAIDINGDGIFSNNEDVNGDGTQDLGEDRNGNGVLDHGEDINSNGVLDKTEDLNYSGVIDFGDFDFDNDGKLDLIYENFDNDGNFDSVNEDLDGDGNFDVTFEDRNMNGILDESNESDNPLTLGPIYEIASIKANYKLDSSDQDNDGLPKWLELFIAGTSDSNSDSNSDGLNDFILFRSGLDSNKDYSTLIAYLVNDTHFKFNHGLLNLDEILDLRPGSTMIEVSGNQATVQLQMEESSDLQTWEDTGTPATMTIPADTDTKFFRFKMAE